MSGGAAPLDPARRGHVREASWLDLPRDVVDVAGTGPPIWRWQVPIRTEYLRIDAYVGPYGEGERSQDLLTVVEHPGRVVLAVADGVTPTHRTPHVGHEDGARFAARVALEHLCAAPPAADLPRVLLTANTALLDRFGPVARSDLHPRDRPQTALVAVALIIDADGAVRVIDTARAADCEIWARHDGDWQMQAPRSMLRPYPKQVLQQWDRDHPTASSRTRIEFERTLLADRSQWNLTALGRFERPKIDKPTIQQHFDELVLVTDGAKLAASQRDIEAAPRDWMATLRTRTGHYAAASKDDHTDVAMLHLRVARPHHVSDRNA